MKKKNVSCELIALWLIEKLISLEIRLNHLISFNKSLFLLRILIQIYKVFLLFYLLDDLFQRFILNTRVLIERPKSTRYTKASMICRDPRPHKGAGKDPLSWDTRHKNGFLYIFLKNGPSPASFSLFLAFSNKQDNLYNKSTWKISISAGIWTYNLLNTSRLP